MFRLAVILVFVSALALAQPRPPSPAHPPVMGGSRVSPPPVGANSPGLRRIRDSYPWRIDARIPVYGNALPRRHPVYVPYLPTYPFVGGAGYWQPPQQNFVNVIVPPQPAPSVVVNNSYTVAPIHPETTAYGEGQLPEPGRSSPALRSYAAPGGARMPAADTAPAKSAPTSSAVPGEQKAEIYLVAFKDASVLSAYAVWVKGNMLHYVTTSGVKKQRSIDQVDLDLTRRLNSERKVELKLEDN